MVAVVIAVVIALVLVIVIVIVVVMSFVSVGFEVPMWLLCFQYLFSSEMVSILFVLFRHVPFLLFLIVVSLLIWPPLDLQDDVMLIFVSRFWLHLIWHWL